MNNPILYEIPAWLIASVIFVLVIIINWAGFRLRKKQIAGKTEAEIDSIGSIEGAMLGLMALLLAFSFGMAATKFDERRKIIVEEANDIGTAILRSDLYSDSIRKLFLQDFSSYLDARIAYYNAGVNNDNIRLALEKAEVISARLWKRATLSHDPSNPARTLQMIPALNSMIDIVTTRESARESKVPPLILFMLLILTLVSAFLTGYNYKGKRRSMVMVTGFALMMALTLYLVMELDRPRRGLISLDAAQAKIAELKKLTVE
jgi:Na+/H+ antiporter NhaC